MALDLLRSERAGLLSLSVPIGLGAGLGAVAFRYLIQVVTPAGGSQLACGAAVGPADPG